MIGYFSKAFFHALAGSRTLKQLASRYGMRRPNSFARRFIAGETVEEAIAVARTLQSRGLLLTLDYLGESVRTIDEANAATREYVRLIDVIVASGIERNISLKTLDAGEPPTSVASSGPGGSRLRHLVTQISEAT